jgi:hypothetical protein
MDSRFKMTALATALAMGTTLTLSQAIIAAPEFAEGRILVKPAAGLSEKRFNGILKQRGLEKKRKLRGSEVGVVKTPKGREQAMVRALSRNPHIAFAELDYRVPLAADVNDPGFSKQWHLPVMQAPAAWDVANGDGIVVAVLDTGVSSSHPDLSGKVLTGYNTVTNDSSTSDFHDHGTMVSGVIAAYANNGVGGASVAPGTRILPIRITNDGYAYFSDMAEGIAWASENGAHIANISFSGAAGSSTVANAASNMMSKGGIVVVAAANDGIELSYDNSPYLYVVGSTNSSEQVSGFSNYGRFVDVSAPGEMIYTTNRSGGYSYVQGTSFSSPNVAAVAALVMAANPSLTPTDVMAVVSSTADDLGDPGWDPYYGHGRVNALAAVDLAANAKTSDITAPTVAVSSPADGRQVQGDVSILVQASDDFGVTQVDLLVNGVKVSSETHATDAGYLFAWDSSLVADGEYRLSARAADAAGNVGVSTDVVVNVANTADEEAPVAHVTSPSDGASVSRNVSLSGFATDNDQVVEFSLLVNGQVKCAGTSSASCGWNTRKEADGSYAITARAVDRSGNVGQSSITVTIGSTSSDDGSSDDNTDTVKTNPGKGRKK